MTEAPWTVDGDDLERMRAAGVTEEGVVQAVTIAAVFNHLTRVADGTGVAPDYASPLPRLQVDPQRQAAARPARRDWPSAASEPRLSLALRPRTQAAIAAWATYARTGSAGLTMRDRQFVGHAVASCLCDAEGMAAWQQERPAEAGREAALIAYAQKLTVTPWRMAAADLAPLRAYGLDDRALLDVIGLVGFQNMESRLRLARGHRF